MIDVTNIADLHDIDTASGAAELVASVSSNGC